jgi:hypothetical protein
MGTILGLWIWKRTLDRELGVGHDEPEPMLPEVIVEVVPIRADGRVAGRWRRSDRLGLGQDAVSRSPSVANQSIELVADVGDLLLEPSLCCFIFLSSPFHALVHYSYLRYLSPTIRW